MIKRLNHIILFTTVVMVSISGCSHSKLRNLLGRNEYQSLEERNAQQHDLANSNKTQIVSSETEEANSVFKLPGFLKGEEKSAALAPDPFLDDVDTAAIEDETATYRAKVDERIARQAAEVRESLSDIEEQARQLYEKSKDSADDTFEAFANATSAATSTAQDAAIATKDKLDAVVGDQAISFAELFGQRPETSPAETASAFVTDTTASPSFSSDTPEVEMSEFDKLLHDHQRHTNTQIPEITTGSNTVQNSDIFAELDQSNAKQPRTGNLFGSDFFSHNQSSPADSDTHLTTDNQNIKSMSDIWAQVDGNNQDTKLNSTNDTLAAVASPTQPASVFESFEQNFQQAADRHGFSNSSTWENVATAANQDVTILPPPVKLQHAANGRLMVDENHPAMNISDTRHDNLTSAPESSPFVLGSQSQVVDSTQSTSQGMGLIIPASESSDDSQFLSFNEQPARIHPVSSTQPKSLQIPAAADRLEDDINLFDEATTSPAVQTLEIAGGWTPRTWFLIIGCVLIAGLLFLPERKKR